MLKRFSFILFIILVFINGINAQEHRNALLIANNTYETEEKEQKEQELQGQNLDENILLFSNLKTPITEALELKAVLEDLGFNVTLLENADKKQIRTALRNFHSKTQEEKGLAFFHYGGHAIQINGINYLIPANCDVISDIDIKEEAVSIDDITESMLGENNIIVLDSCRSIPYKSSGTKRGGNGEYRGLASIRSKINFLIVHSASSGESAIDGVFTPIFTKLLKQKNKSLATILMEVRKEVRQQTNNAQNPEDRSQLTQDIYLAGYNDKTLNINGTTGKIEISVISPCFIFLDTINSSVKIAELNAFEQKIIEMPTGSFSITAKYSDEKSETHQCIVRTNEKANNTFHTR